MEQTKREELIELTNNALNCIREIGKQCTKKSYKRLSDKAIKIIIWILIAVEGGEQI